MQPGGVGEGRPDIAAILGGGWGSSDRAGLQLRWYRFQAMRKDIVPEAPPEAERVRPEAAPQA